MPSFMRLIVVVLLATLATFGQEPAKPAAVVDDDAELLGRQTFVENCLICHGEEMSTNQRLTTKQWTAEIDKMIGWGAPVPPEKKAPLLTYLNANFSDNATAAKSDVVPAKEFLAAKRVLTLVNGDASNGAALFTKHCSTCHGAGAQGGDLGTNLVEKSILAGDRAYHEAVRKGVRRMPGFASVLDAKAESDVLSWLRGLRVP